MSEAEHVSVLNNEASDDRDKEHALVELARIHTEHKNAQALAELVTSSRPVLARLPKAKAAKIIKGLIDRFSEIPDALGVQIDVCRDNVAWCVQENRQFLRQQLETRLVALYLDKRMYSEALVLISKLLGELKRLDDKMVLVEVHLLESKAYHALRNIPKSRAALTSARTNANSIYTPPALQSSLDLMSGILHAEDNDFQTVQSYFLETIDADQPGEAPRATKYLLMCKVMQNLPEEIEAVLSRGKSASGGGGPGKWKQDPGVDALRQVARAQENGSLREFEQTLARHKVELGSDPVVRAHLASLYDSMLERNLLRCVLPYSRVQVAYIAELVSLPVSRVEQKLSQMILDGKISAVLDQGSGWLIVFEPKQAEQTYEHAIQTLEQMNRVVDSLYQKATQLP